MSFGDYFTHIRRKFRVSLALALIKNKPVDITIESYIQMLRSKIIKTQEVMENDAISICSEDFNMDFEPISPNLLEDYSQIFKDDYDVENCAPSHCLDKTQLMQSQVQSQKENNATLDDINITSLTNDPSTILYFNENDKYNYFKPPNENNTDKIDLIKSTNPVVTVDSAVTKDLNGHIASKIDSDPPIHQIQLENQNTDDIINLACDFNEDNCRTSYDSTPNCTATNKNIITMHNGVLYSSLNKAINKNLNVKAIDLSNFNETQNNNYSQEYTHISQTQNIQYINVPENLLLRKRKLDRVNNLNIDNNDDDDCCKLVKKYQNNDTKSDNLNKEMTYNKESNLKGIDVDASKSEINSHDLSDKNNNEIVNFANKKHEIAKIISKNTQYEVKFDSQDDLFPKNSLIEKPVEINKQTQTFKNIDRYDSLFDFHLRYSLDSTNKLNTNVDVNSQNESEVIDTLIHIDNVIKEIQSQNKSKEHQNDKILEEDKTNKVVKQIENIDENSNEETLSSDELNEIVESQSEETVPFKVIAENNKIKTYLLQNNESKFAGSSFDSGFMSDSQKYSDKGGSQTIDGINQSAHCLLKYIMESNVNIASQDIITDIAKTLGDLIDKLHSSESYPSFFDTILQNVEQLSESICTGFSSGENSTLQKEINIHKLLLLNKSTHIIKISLQNLTNNLEHAFTNLTSSDEAYEITNLTAIENLPHTFHLLEILVKRNNRNAGNTQLSCQELTGNTQSTQETKATQKSQITEFWKRKWDPNFDRNTMNSICDESKNINSKLSEVLNKFVVQCMDKYGLIAFAALQCFNVLQSE